MSGSGRHALAAMVVGLQVHLCLLAALLQLTTLSHKSHLGAVLPQTGRLLSDCPYLHTGGHTTHLKCTLTYVPHMGGGEGVV